NLCISHVPSIYSLLRFLHRSSPLRDLQSFPTRRSSDLLPHAVGGHGGQMDGADAPGLHLQREGLSRLYPAPVHAKDLHVEGEVPDRKSTRLNSSHVEISYAVFCLKKKKKLLREMSSGMI